MPNTPIDTAETTTETTTPVEVVEQTPAEPVVQAEPAEPTAQTEEVEPKTFDAAYVDKLRKEAADYRTKRKAEQDRADAVEQKLNSVLDGLKGLTGDKTEEQSPEDMLAAALAERDQATAKLRDYSIRETLTKAAQDAGADAELTTLVLRGKGALDNLDPNHDDYPAQVAALIEAEVTANPKLKATPAVPQSSGSTPEDSSSPRAGQLTRDDMKNMSAKEINDAVKEGRFRDVLGG